MTITKRATAKLSRVSVGLTRHEHNGDEPSVILAVDSNGDGVYINLHLSLEDFDILRETVMDFDVHEALQLEEDAKAPVEGPLVLGGRLHPADAKLEDDRVDPVGGDIETATMLKSKTHDAWLEVVQDFTKGPRYVLHFRALDGQMQMRTGDGWRGNRYLAIERLYELEQSGEAMVKA